MSPGIPGFPSQDGGSMPHQQLHGETPRQEAACLVELPEGTWLQGGERVGKKVTEQSVEGLVATVMLSAGREGRGQEGAHHHLPIEAPS